MRLQRGGIPLITDSIGLRVWSSEGGSITTIAELRSSDILRVSGRRLFKTKGFLNHSLSMALAEKQQTLIRQQLADWGVWMCDGCVWAAEHAAGGGSRLGIHGAALHRLAESVAARRRFHITRCHLPTGQSHTHRPTAAHESQRMSRSA